MKRLTTRSIATATAIRDREDFTTSGALMGNGDRVGMLDYGRLHGADLAAFQADVRNIDYVVWSYSTPIAWHLTTGEWHRVTQSFSTTTAKHMGNLYLLPIDHHRTAVTGKRGDWYLVCQHGCTAGDGGGLTHHTHKADADAAAHRHFLNPRTARFIDAAIKDLV